MSSITMQTSEYDGTFELILEGRLDGLTMKEVEDKLEQDIFSVKKEKVLLHLGKLDYISSAGLRVMLLALKRITAYKGKLVLCELQPNVLDIFKLSGFSSIFTILPTRDEAIAQL